MAEIRLSSNRPIHIKITMDQIAVAIMFLLTILTGLFNQMILSLGVMFCCFLLLLCDKLYMAFPFVIFYNSFYGLVFGMSVLRVYTFLVLINMLLWRSKQPAIKRKYLPPLFVYLLFLVVVILPNTSQALPLVLEIISCFFVVSELTERPESMHKFFAIYAILCLCSFLTGVVCENTIGDEYSYIRFNATFEDPNYMGFFFTIGIFALFSLKLFHPIIRTLIIIVIYAMMLTSLSVTAIVVNVLVWAFYLVFIKKLKPSVLIVCVLAVAVVVSLFFYGLENPETPVIGDFAERINEKLEELESGNIGDATTGRTDIAQKNFAYYGSLSVFRILFGGLSANARYIHPDLEYASHNEYIDMLLNVGVVGALILFGYFFSTFITHVRHYRKTKEDRQLCFLMSKVIWLCYAAGLTMFIDYRFMLIFLF